MRIWFINHYALPPTCAGGTRHYNFAKKLMERGHEVVIIAANYNHLTHEVISHTPPGTLDRRYTVPFLWIPILPYRGNTLGRFFSMLQFSYRLLQKKQLNSLAKPDIICGSSPQLFAAFSAERLARRHQAEFILEIRDIWPESLVDLGRFTHKHPLIRVMKYIEHYLYKRAVRLITLLPSAQSYFLAQGVQQQNLLWLPNTVNIDAIPPALVNTFPSPHPFTVMYAGAHGVANDLGSVLDAAHRLHAKGLTGKVKIILIGDGPEKAHLMKRAKDEHLGAIVEFLNPIAKKDIYRYLANANACLLLLKKSPVFRWGISPNKLFDYLAMARPIIFGVATPFNPVEISQAGLSITPSDGRALADAIEALMGRSEEELRAMGARGRAYLLEHHHLDKLTDQLETFLAPLTDNCQ